jgi:deoxyadenosine/deoxycytidine kinase
MILLINGSFGVGKTTVGSILRRRIAGSVLYNPEWTGSVLMRLPLKFRGSGTGDFQNIDIWRKSVVRGIRFFRLFADETVIVPMAFSRKEYLREVLDGVRKFDDRIRIFCLKADFEVILRRLAARGDRVADFENDWIARQAKVCIAAHNDDYFGESINTADINAFAVAQEILNRLGED